MKSGDFRLAAQRDGSFRVYVAFECDCEFHKQGPF
jgi:hypothetical protein